MLHFALLASAAALTPVAPPPSSAPTVPAAQSTEAGPALPSVDLPRRPRGVTTPSFLTAGDLQAKCQDKALAMVSYCYAYVTGVHDSVKAYEVWLNMREFCRPLRMSQSELRQAFLEYLGKNPAAIRGEAASVVVIALRQKYACDAPVAPAATDPVP
ncbi:Rap1a/Tai family immunity protein [Novosphingobium soli]|uniref:Rap1a/Tai family immunity protein n=1 Tax=Novosphingobium soli TaxID=574956 RepID=A0ABV6CXD6_9SPHN